MGWIDDHAKFGMPPHVLDYFKSKTTAVNTWLEDPEYPGRFFWQGHNAGYLWYGENGDAQWKVDTTWRSGLTRVTRSALEAIAKDGTARAYVVDPSEEMVRSARAIIASTGDTGTRSRHYGPMWTNGD